MLKNVLPFSSANSSTGNPVNNLVNAFSAEILAQIKLGKKYTGKVYAQLLRDTAVYGAVHAVKCMIHQEMNGKLNDYYKLYMAGRTDLLVEGTVVKYSALFTQDEVDFCLRFFLPKAA